MNRSRPSRLNTLMSYLTPPHPCGYLANRDATNQFINPEQPIDTRLYNHLIKLGFRRSGDYVYRPRCFGCSECIPVRIPVNEFRPSRSQRRNLRDNADLTVTAQPPEFNQEHFDLYRRYLRWRHAGGGMENPSPRDYMGFLTSRLIDTCFYEFRDGNALVGVAATDCLPDSLSAVYTFYDPHQLHRGIGAYAVLWQVAEAVRRGLSWTYLGYWINACEKMQYKRQYRPLEIFRQGHWIRVDRLDTPPA